MDVKFTMVISEDMKMLLIRVTKRKALLLLFFYQKTEVKGP